MKQLEELCESRRNDLKKLIQERNSRCHQFCWLEIKRLLFVYAVCCSTLEYAKSVRELKEIENQLPHYSDNYYNSLCKNLKSYCHFYSTTGKCKYFFSNAKLISMLKITKYEESYLDSIISDEERERRENLLINEELEKRRIDSEIESSIQTYEMNQELKKSSNEFKDFTGEEFREYSKKAFEELGLGLDEIIFGYRDDSFIYDSDM